MAKTKRKVPGINASSTADISFMLLIFFLITTSMDTDRGLARRLPPPPESEEQKRQLKDKAKEFIANPNDDPNMPEKHRKNLPFFGDVMITEKHVISVQNDVGTSYDVYIQVQNELVAAYNELRNELAMSQFGKSFADCSEEQKEAIIDYYPQKISEAEPKKYGGK